MGYGADLNERVLAAPFHFLIVSRLTASSRSSSEGLSQQADAAAALKKRVNAAACAREVA